ncbi:MAG: Holliday junction resolvase RuvX, partial [Gammaproteobacteria bacterium]|nr:Holliday junction resolvase RuvX [Gammaproteobacteria bacterium]
MPEPRTSIKSVLGFDFGMKRIGVAIGQTITATARPLDVLPALNGAPNWEDVS